MATIAREKFQIDSDLLSAALLHTKATQNAHYLSTTNSALERKEHFSHFLQFFKEFFYKIKEIAECKSVPEELEKFSCNDSDDLFEEKESSKDYENVEAIENRENSAVQKDETNFKKPRAAKNVCLNVYKN